jgi:hypothetical protein
MRPRPIVLISGVVGAILGALVAFVGTTELFVCRETSGFGSAVCASENGILAVMWGVPIGLVVGLAIGLAITRSRRRAAAASPS